jgi:drug/metabolite transporter (DMT)-like permease
MPPLPPAAAERPFAAIIAMLGAIVCLSGMDALGKALVLRLPVVEVIFVRSCLVMVMLAPLVVLGGGRAALRTAQPWTHALRVGFAAIAIVTFFTALRELPLATAIAIGFAAPLFMTLLSIPLLGEKVGPHRWAAVIVGFLGVVVIARPSADDAFSLAALLAVVSCLFYGANMVLTRRLTRTDGDLALLVYLNGGVCLVMAAAAPFFWTPLGWAEFGLIAAMAAMLLLGQFFMVRAFRHGSVGLVAPFHYLELPLAAAIGWLVWREMPGPNVWYGAVIVVAAGLYIIWRERVRARAARAAPVAI